MPFIYDVQTALPKHHYTQKELFSILKEVWEKRFRKIDKIEQFHNNMCVEGRNLALPIEKYLEFKGFGEKNDQWIEVASQLALESVTKLIEKTGVKLEDIGMLMSTTITGLAVPSLEARLMNKIPFKRHTKRIPLFGLGCLAGAAGINRASDYLLAHPKEAVIFFSVELCSLTVQFDDFSIANMVSSGLFGDGAAAVLLVGDEHPLAKEAPLKWLGGQSNFFPDSERVMGWDIVDTGFKIVLSKDVSHITSENVPKDLDLFLENYSLKKEDIGFVMAHPGGPKVLEALEESLELNPNVLKHSWNGLKNYGNMSSVSVLFVINDTLRELPQKGSYGLSLAMGPAFCSEMGLFQCMK